MKERCKEAVEILNEVMTISAENNYSDITQYTNDIFDAIDLLQAIPKEMDDLTEKATNSEVNYKELKQHSGGKIEKAMAETKERRDFLNVILEKEEIAKENEILKKELNGYRHEDKYLDIEAESIELNHLVALLVNSFRDLPKETCMLAAWHNILQNDKVRKWRALNE